MALKGKMIIGQSAIEEAIRQYIDREGYIIFGHLELRITGPSSDGPLHSSGSVSAEVTVSKKEGAQDSGGWSG